MRSEPVGPTPGGVWCCRPLPREAAHAVVGRPADAVDHARTYPSCSPSHAHLRSQPLSQALRSRHLITRCVSPNTMLPRIGPASRRRARHVRAVDAHHSHIRPCLVDLSPPTRPSRRAHVSERRRESRINDNPHVRGGIRDLAARALGPWATAAPVRTQARWIIAIAFMTRFIWPDRRSLARDRRVGWARLHWQQRFCGCRFEW